MTADRRARFTATGALGAALLSLGLSTWAVGCRDRAPADTDEPVSTAPAVVHVAAQSPNQSAPAPEPAVKPAGTTVTKSASAPTSAKSSAKSVAGELSVRRLVVAHAIENREPVSVAELKLGDSPIVAFVELANSGSDEQRVIVTFERGGSSVGHIQLRVPAQSRRWRTWAETRRIREPGEWQAVVHSEDGKELSRTTFSVVK
jgi:hypothetical protein